MLTTPLKIAAVLLSLLLLPTLANATEKRLALLVGIADYQHIQRLRNTLNDSRLLADTLEKLDFDVTVLENPGLDRFRSALADFAFRAETADVALIYFAGHAIEFDGRNFLLPADIDAADRADIAAASIRLYDLLLAVDMARQLRIVILDSCRNDPFAGTAAAGQAIAPSVTGGSRVGLAPPSPERGTLVAYAAKAGAVAFDGNGANSPFVLALAEHLPTPDLEISLTFRRVRDSVLRATENQQEPHTYGSLSGIPYFLAGRSQVANSLESKQRKDSWAFVSGNQKKVLTALADEGDTRALLGLAYIHLNPDDKSYDVKRAFSLLQRAAERNDPEALYELGRLYETGIGTEQDPGKAVELYRRAAALDYADAINDLGFLYFNGGVGIARDPEKAIELFGRAAELRHPQAMFNYAALIDDGLVPGKTPAQAAIHLYRALRSGAEDVLKQLSENPRMFKQATRRELQELLADASFYDGAIDGQIGPATKLGMRRAYGFEE
ncbi:MAG: SEL1-like repeat protein [Hyphomicrobiales bacterium]|nr:SEL1-like repeat protein [Hyphomicrobiales bacterium]